MINSTLCYIKKDNEYLLLFRDKKENDVNECKWVGVGGKFEEGESADECLLREVKEETGLTLTHYTFHGVVNFYSDKWEDEAMYLYSADAFEGDLVADCPEGTLKFVPEEDVLSLPTWEGDKYFLKELLKGTQNLDMSLYYEGDNLVAMRNKNYATFGKGEKVLVIVPGISLLPVSPGIMGLREAYKVFEDEYTVYVVDRKPGIQKGYLIGQMAEDVYEILRENDIKKANLFGVSQGGIIVLKLALKHPEIVEKVAVCSSLIKIYPGYKEKLSYWADLARENKREELIDSFLDHVYSEATLKAYKSVIVDSFKDATDADFMQFANMTDTFEDVDISENMKELKAPLFVVGCEGDKAIPPEALQDLIPYATEHLVYDSTYGHAVYDEAPDIKIKLKNFFD